MAITDYPPGPCIWDPRVGYSIPMDPMQFQVLPVLPAVDSTGNVSTATRCPWCDGIHNGICHRVKSIEYFPDGMIKAVEFIGNE